jgi:hypothetical protein
VNSTDGNLEGMLVIGMDTGSIHGFHAMASSQPQAG